MGILSHTGVKKTGGAKRFIGISTHIIETMGYKNLPGLRRKKERADGLKEIGQCPGVSDEVTTQPKRSGSQLRGQIKVKNAETSDFGGERFWVRMGVRGRSGREDGGIFHVHSEIT